MALSHANAASGAPTPLTDSHGQMQGLWRKFVSVWDKDNGTDGLSEPSHKGQDAEQPGDARAGIIRRVSRKVVPGLPRAQTFKRQRSEVRSRLEPVRPTTAERRAVSMDRRLQDSSTALNHSDPRTSAPDFLHHSFSDAPSSPSYPMSPLEDFLHTEGGDLDGFDLDRYSTIDAPVHDHPDVLSKMDIQSMTTSQYDALIESELERKWILNLSMHFRDKSKREKFFVTFRQHEHHWRRVTISLDYRSAPENSLEAELSRTEYQRDKSAKIYDAVRDSLAEIEFYSTVTNLKLETKDGRLHVHVVEDVNEVISYPPIRMIQHMNCTTVKEREIHFDSHMSGFVYKVRVHGRLLIKKEIPGPDTVDEFLYEINALNQLTHAKDVIQFYGVVVDDRAEHVTGLLISYASQGALIDAIYDNNHSLPWPTREKWARQIVGGLSEIHEAGFVQGDFTLSNIVIDENNDAKIIDINRRGCPIGWEPPEATPLVDSNQRISMYIGVKSDLYQLGMVLWALATQEDEPDACGRPLKIDPDVQVPSWYRRVVDTCLSDNPRDRVQAIQLLSWFPDSEEGSHYASPSGHSVPPSGDGIPRHDYLSPADVPRIKPAHPPSDWVHGGWGSHVAEEPFYYPSRGRSPPSPMPSNPGDYNGPRYGHRMYTWSDSFNHAPPVPSVSDVLARDARGESMPRLQGSEETRETYADGPYRFRGTVTDTSRDDDSFVERGRSLSRRDHHYDAGPESAGDEEVSQERMTTTWGPPPKHWRFGDERHDSGKDVGSDIREPGGNEIIGTASQADSGKDVTEMASTPREPRGYFSDGRQRSVSRGRSGRSSASRQNGQQTTAAATAAMGSYTLDRSPALAPAPAVDISRQHHGPDPTLNRNEHEHEHPQGNTPSIFPSDPAPPPTAGLGHSHDDLKGIGSAYGPAELGPLTIDDFDDLNEKRQHEIIIDESLMSSEFDKSLRQAQAQAHA